MSVSPSSSRNALALCGFLFVTFCAPALSAFIGMPGPWYAALNKPSWNPPPWLFGPAWTLLYTLMAIAAWMVWKRVGFAKPLKLYFVQLALNAAWTPIFFGANAMGWALAEIVALWIAILMTLRAFWAVSRPAGMLLVPYLAWVSFASVLNFTLWRLNS
jgi:tryptophan-rich sensory protein